MRHFPIADMGIPSPRDTLDLCRFILAKVELAEPVAVHCKAGLGRTGTVLACCLVTQGASPEDAVQQLRLVNNYYIQTQAQEMFIRHYADYLRQHEAQERSSDGSLGEPVEAANPAVRKLA